MSVREKIGKMPVWKAATVSLLAIFFLVAGVEKVFVSRVFNFMNSTVTTFEKEKQDDLDDLEEMDRNFEERQGYDRAESDLSTFDMEQHMSLPQQVLVCGRATMIKKLENFFQLAYVKRHPGTQKYITERIESEKQYIADQIKTGDFDPSVCKDYSP